MKPWFFFYLFLYAVVVKKIIIYRAIAASFSRAINWISNFSCWFCFVSSKRSSLLFLLVQMFLFLLLMKEHLLDMILSMPNICRSLFLFSWKLTVLLDRCWSCWIDAWFFLVFFSFCIFLCQAFYVKLSNSKLFQIFFRIKYMHIIKLFYLHSNKLFTSQNKLFTSMFKKDISEIFD